MGFKVGEHGVTMAGEFNSAVSISVTSICGDLLETFTCVLIRKTEERAGGCRDGIQV